MMRARCAQRLDLAQHDGERIVDGRHEDAAHDVDHADRPAVVASRATIAAVARRAGRVVGRPQQPRLGADVVERFLLVPDVVARGHHVDAAVEQLVADLARDAEAGGRVLGVGDDEVDRVAVDEGRQPVLDQVAPGPADDVADEEQSRMVDGCGMTAHGQQDCTAPQRTASDPCNSMPCYGIAARII